MQAPQGKTSRAGAGALLIGAGILLSRLAGLVRQRVFAHYFATDAAADAYTAALRIPNLLQNLLGEGVLSASFIPIYASLRARGTPGDERQARGVAGAVAGLLGLTAGLVALLGMAATPWLIRFIAPGFQGATRQLAIELVQIFFPGTSLLVLSAFCLGVLNSHRRFFLSYVAPVVWNAAIVASMLLGGERWHLVPFELAHVAAWGMVVGSALQLAVQVPLVLRLLGGPRAALSSLSLGRRDPNVRAVIKSFGPAVVGRGVVQISAFIDMVIASWLPHAPSALGYAQAIYTLPISLFGMSVSAAALPEMSSAHGEAKSDGALHTALREQLVQSGRHIAFTVVPSAVAFVALGDVINAAVYQTGRYHTADARYVWAILAGSAVGLLGQTLGRLYSGAFYALRDTRTPLRYATLRVVLTAALGLLGALWLPGVLGLEPRWGAVGLSSSAGLAGWVEFALLRRNITARVGSVALGARLQGALWASAVLGAAAGWAAKLAVPSGVPPWLRAMLVLGSFGLVYLGSALLFRVPEAHAALARVRRILRISNFT